MTLMELMIVISVIAIIVMIAAPRFGTMIRTSNENNTRAQLNAIRKALSLYQTDFEGAFPSDLAPLTQPGSKYLSKAPAAYTAAHGSLTSVDYGATLDAGLDNGSWGYVNAGPQWGHIWVQCSHTDSKGKTWNQY